MNKKKIFTEILILSFYTLIFLILSWPLALNFSSGIIAPYNSDGPIFLWNAWALDFSLYTDKIFYPHRTPLGLHTFTLFNSIIIRMLNYLFHNLVFSFNLVFLLTTVFGAYFTYRFIDLHIKYRIASVLAGQIFAFQALWSIYALFGTQNFLGLWYIPASLFFYELFRRKNKIIFAFVVGIIIAFAFLNGFYPFIFSVVGLVVYALLINFKIIEKIFIHYIRVALASLFAFVIFAAWKMLALIKQVEFIRAVPAPLLENIDRIYHADPMNIVRPVQFHPLWGHWHTWFVDVSIENGNAFVGFTFFATVLLFLVIKFSQKTKLENKKLFYIFLLAYFLILTLSFGPYLHLFGVSTGIPMPHLLIQSIMPAFNNIRFPARWLMPAQIFLAGFTAVMLKYIFQNITKKIWPFLFLVIGLGLVIDVAFLPREISTIYGEETLVFEEIGKEQNEKSVLYMPLAINDGYFNMGETHKRSMAYQIIHKKPIIGGHLSRLPLEYKIFYGQEAVLKYLLTYKFNDPDEEDLDKDNIQKFYDIYNVGYIVIEKQNLENGDVMINYLINDLDFSKYFEDEYFLLLKK